jgi:dipeptidyl aminopeptidase/acylaminoacyl peptidase
MLKTLKARIAEIGPQFDPAILQETFALYRPLLPQPSASVRVQLDIPYAPDERQRLDLYAPAKAASLPVLLYVPGGGFVGGDKQAEDGFWANIGYDFAQRGFLVLIMNHRLAPRHPWPAGGEDVGHAVAWAREHAAALGGDPSRIAIFGQSAGATHVLTWLFDPSFEGAKPVSAAILASGTYHVAGGKIPPNVMAYFGPDPSLYEARSPITHVRRTTVPFLLTVSEFDPPFLASPTFELAEKLTNANGRSPQLNWLAGHNHVSNVVSIGTADDVPANLVADFLKDTLAG